MLATLADDAPLQNPRLVYELKYDGIRALVDLRPGARGGVTIRSRLGNDKTAQFPEVARELARFASRLDAPLLVDGEIVALDGRGRPASFQRLQGRMHLTSPGDIDRAAKTQPVALYLFDLLRDGDADLRRLPLVERRAWLERRFKPFRSTTIHLTETATGDGTALYERAETTGGEGLIVKDLNSRYESGRRTPAWRKKKVLRRQEFVVGGWTGPRRGRMYFGALLLGVYDKGRLKYAGSVGTGFSDAELKRVMALLERLHTGACPFDTPPQTLEVAHWVRPALVAEVRFTEWTDEQRLRHPVYLGLRDDVEPRKVTREVPGSTVPGSTVQGSPVVARRRAAASPSRAARKSTPASRRRSELDGPALDAVIARLDDLQARGKDGPVELPGGDIVRVTNLSKVFWPELKITKGDLLRYYVRVSPYLLPAVADRPLVMKRFPNGIHGKAFYQQRVKDDERPPKGVHIEVLGDDVDPIGEEGARRLIGGSLTTLLYQAQMAAISQDPWFSRIGTPYDADYVAIDLDPSEGVPFSAVNDVARWVHEELERLGVPGVPKTSGSRGLHIYIPLPPGTSYESGQLFCNIVATIVATKHPRVATVERKVKARGKTVYVDYLQNILGKTLATAYSVRASRFAGVSTPLAWDEVHEGVDPEDFTIRTAIDRFRSVGDLWARLRTGPPADLRAAVERAGGVG
jgi:bifunctional non-homologous end joining protein LigD